MLRSPGLVIRWFRSLRSATSVLLTAKAHHGDTGNTDVAQKTARDHCSGRLPSGSAAPGEPLRLQAHDLTQEPPLRLSLRGSSGRRFRSSVGESGEEQTKWGWV